MSYIVLARKYRPQTFDDVVAQSHVTQTLKNAISSNRVAHALLFSGPRGTGKTTLARIFAKAMNCAEGPTSTPCNQCPSCREITAGSSPDVFEIDGASNNKVEDARELMENVNYAPVSSRYKIYIIDEVHMLSNSAFNALLKTIEEPPAHVLFVLATTEPHKLLPTILSRCQRYDLSRIAMPEIVEYLKKLTQKEAFEIDEPSLWAVARATGGCMRDALSLLDQIIASAQGSINHEEVLELIGAADSGVLAGLAEALFNRDAPACLNLVEKLFVHGFDMKKVAGDLILFLRNCAVIKMVPDASRLVDLPASEIETIAGKIRRVPPGAISLLLNSLLQQEATLRYASNPRLALEVILLRCCELTPVLSMDSIIQGLDQLEKKLSQQAFSGPCPPPAQVEPPQQPKPSESRTSDVKQDNRPEEKASGPAVNRPDEQSPPQATVKNEPGEIRPPRPQDKAVSSPKKPGAGSFLQKLKEANPALGSQLEKCPMSFSENTFVIELDESLAAIAHGTDLAGKKALEDACASVFGQDTVLELKLLPQPKPADRDDDNSWKKNALKHPLINDAMEIFDGDIFDIVKHKIPAQPETALAGEDGQTAEE